MPSIVESCLLMKVKIACDVSPVAMFINQKSIRDDFQNFRAMFSEDFSVYIFR